MEAQANGPWSRFDDGTNTLGLVTHAAATDTTHAQWYLVRSVTEESSAQLSFALVEPDPYGKDPREKVMKFATKRRTKTPTTISSLERKTLTPENTDLMTSHQASPWQLFAA